MAAISRRDRVEAALIGAYVADAAALGLHWLYDADRIAALAPSGFVFRAPDVADFDGFKGVYVHHGKQAGDVSQYGAQMQVMVQSLTGKAGFDLADYQDRFAATFGAGGSWVGYMDKATKGTLANLAADQRAPSGADDDQVPAISKLPPLVAIGADAKAIDDAVTATSANATARAYAPAMAAALRAAFDGAGMPDCLTAGVAAADGEVAAALTGAIDSPENDSVVFAGEVGRACPLPQALPVMFHIAARSASCTEAIERNILAGGDNCGRSICLGALFGAMHGTGGTGVPLNWIARLSGVRELAEEIDAFCEQLS